MAQSPPMPVSADKNKLGTKPITFEYHGDKIVIPESLTLDQAAEAIQRQIQEESVEVSISETIQAFPLDGAVALMRVLKRRYGWSHLVPERGFWGPRPPVMVGVETGPDTEDRIQVPWGKCQVPNVTGTIETSYSFDNGMPVFRITGVVLRKDEKVVASIAQEVRKEIKENSIYRGKAIKINFRDNDGDRAEFNIQLAPRFMKFNGFTEPIFSKAVEGAIKLNILNPIRYSDRCRKNGVSLKKGVLLGGPYGTGKTLTSHQVAKVCVENNWTFIYLEDVRDLDLAIGFAKLYQPCVLFAEDVDKAVAGSRTSEMDKLLNSIDGIESKGDQSFITVLTTNHIESIHRAFIRPGRIDAVINVLPPDKEACVRIVKMYVSEGDCAIVGTDEELQDAISCLVGANAAFFKTTVDQAKLSAIGNMQDNDEIITIRPNDLKVAAEAMVPHCKLINPDHGLKDLMDMKESGSDPMNQVVDLVTEHFAQTFITKLVSPKTLDKAMFKLEKRRGGGSVT